MRVELNLAALPSHRERYALAWAVPLLLAGAVGLAFFTGLAVRNVREYVRVSGDLAQLRKEQVLLAGKENSLHQKLDQPAYRRTAREATYVNGLIEAKKLSAAELAAQVSKLLPPTVRLTGLALSLEGRRPHVRFSVSGKDESSVEDFLSNLEGSPNFQDVAIVNEGFEAGGPGEPVQVVFTARYLEGALR